MRNQLQQRKLKTQKSNLMEIWNQIITYTYTYVYSGVHKRTRAKAGVMIWIHKSIKNNN
jgi:hypothetical protein